MFLGQVCKTKDGNGKYLKVYKDHVLSDGTFLNIKSPQEELSDARASFEAGRISEEMFKSIQQRIEDYKPFVVATISYDKE
jgi:hypothetical protein